MGADGKPLVQPGELPNCNMRLYGGAQFHRAMAEFRVGVGQMACPSVTRVSSTAAVCCRKHAAANWSTCRVAATHDAM